MAEKTVTVNAKMGAGTKVEAQIREHHVTIDQPAAGGGNNEGPTPLEYFFFSVAGCMGSIARIMAMQRKIDLRSMDITVSGTLDTDVLLGKTKDRRTGFQHVIIDVKMDSDMTEEQEKDFIEEVEHRCPVSENVCNTTPVKLSINS